MGLLRIAIVTTTVVASYVALALEFESITLNQTAAVGEDITLECKANTTRTNGSVTISWLKGNIPVQNLGDSRIRIGRRLDVGAIASLAVIITKVRSSDSGVYNCKLTSGPLSLTEPVLLSVLVPTKAPTGGITPSRTVKTTPIARVSVGESLRVVVSSSIVLLTINGTTSVGCFSEKGARIEWVKDGELMQERANLSHVDVGLEYATYVVISSSESTSEMTFLNSQRSLAGIYVCQATKDNETSSATVLIQAPPAIVPHFKKDERTTLLTGQSASFQCIVRGYPTPNVSWRQDGVPLRIPPACIHPLDASNNTVDNYEPVCREDDCIFRDCRQSIVTQTRQHSANDWMVTQKLILHDLDSTMAGTYECVGVVGNTTAHNETMLRVHSRLRPLWPAIGIVAEVIVLVFAVLIGEAVEKKKKEKKLQKLKLEREKSSQDTGNKSPTTRTSESGGFSPRKRTVSTRSETELFA